MAVFTEPTKWAQTLGQDADVTSIPDTASDTDPSIDKIFPSVFSIPLAQGGRAIPRSVLNGLFKLVGDWSFYAQNGGIASYSNTFDYAVGSFVKYNNEFYRCIQTNGVSSSIKVPTDSAYWSKITTLADINNAFANQDLSNVTNTANILMVHNVMPSSVFDTLTVGVNGSKYIAPADGYFSFWGLSTDNNKYMSLINTTDTNIASSVITYHGIWIRIFLPVRKGSEVTLNYSATFSNSVLYFVYAIGSESEQA